MSCECDPLLVGEAGPQGPQGLTGIPGTNGTNGVNAYSTTTASFVQPSVSGSVGVLVDNNSWIGQGQILYIASTGYYQVTGIAGTTGLTLSLIQTDGVATAATASSGRKVSPSGNVTSAASLPSLTVSGSATFQQGISVNTSGANSDTSIAGDNDSSMFFVDASADRIGIGTNSPSSKLDVNGTFRVSGDSDLRGSVIVNQNQGVSGDFRVLGNTAANLIFADASADRVGINTSSPNALLDISGALNAQTAVINPSLSTGTVFTVRGGSSAYRIHVVNDAVGIGTSTPSTVGVGSGETNLTVNGVLNAVKLAVGTGTVSAGLIRMNLGTYTIPAGGLTLTANAVTSQDVTVTGSQQGDFVLVGMNGLNTNTAVEGIGIQAHVTAAGTVRVALRNFTGSAVVLAATTTIRVLALGAQALP